jgi:putative sterol carrier protein
MAELIQAGAKLVCCFEFGSRERIPRGLRHFSDIILTGVGRATLRNGASGRELTMTWQGGKRGREARPLPVFARLKALAGVHDTPEQGLQMLATALRDFAQPVHIHVRLISGDKVEHWEVQGGSETARAQPNEPQNADVIVAMRPQTWVQIAQGQLAPYEALFAGKLRVGGNFELAKAITKHLSDPASNYVAPC